MDLTSLVQALGGLAIFLLAMRLMTEGLTLFAGNRLKHLLGNWTSTPWRGVGVGVLVTGLVQSSSAVTVATIGFVNAGILSLRQAMGVIFGTNVGTTMTAWLVSLVGFGFKIDALALPIISLGVVIRLLASGARNKGLGDAITGFGLFFLGLDLLKTAFDGMATSFSANLEGVAGPGWASMILVGFVATLLTQSSSAAIAIILTAASGGVIGFAGAAAAVIGANLGTTSTAALAALKATPAAKRLALSHIGFNLITGVVALCLLPLLIQLVALLGELLDIERSPTALLALFHSVFNILGVIIMLPLVNRFARLLEMLFRSSDEDSSLPRHLDATLTATPILAVAAIHQELNRLSKIVVSIMAEALGNPAASTTLGNRSAAAHSLAAAIGSFIAGLRADAMERRTADELADALYCARYFQQTSQLIPALCSLVQGQHHINDQASKEALATFLLMAEDCLDPDLSPENPAIAPLVDRLRQAHRQARLQLLNSAVNRTLILGELEELLDNLDLSRRAIETRIKAGHLLDHNQKVTDGLKPENGLIEDNVR